MHDARDFQRGANVQCIVMAMDATLPRRSSFPTASAVVWLRWGACAVAVAVLGRTLANADIPRAAALIANAGVGVAAIFVPSAVAIALDAVACRTLFGALTRAPSYVRVLAARYAGEAVAMSLPAGAIVVESLNPLLLRRRCGLTFGDAVAGMAAKKWLVMRAHAVYIALGAALGFEILSERSRAVVGFAGLPWIVLGSAVVPLALSIGLQASLAKGSVSAKLVTVLRSIPSAKLRAWLASREGSIAETDDRFARIAAARGASAKALAIFVFTWLLESAETMIILRTLGVEVAFVEVLSFEAGLSLLRSVAFFSPAGLGVQDLGYIAFLRTLDVPEAASIAAAFVLLKRAKEIVFVALGYFVLWATTRTSSKAPSQPADARLVAGSAG